MAGMYALLLAVLVLSSFQMFSAALNEESEDFSDWRDPTDMINYDLATGKMRNSEARGQDRYATTSAKPECEAAASVEAYKQCESTASELRSHVTVLNSSVISLTQQVLRCSAIHQEVFFHQYVRSLLQQLPKLAAPPECVSDHYQVNVHMSPSQYKYLKDYVDQRQNSTAEVHSILSSMLRDFRWESCFEDIVVESSLWQQSKEWLWIFTQGSALICCIIWLFINVPRSGRWILSRLVTASFLVSIPWTWWHLYKKEVAKRHADLLKSMPDGCGSGRKSVWGFLTSWLWSQNAECVRHFESVEIDPLWEVPPTKAVAVTFVKFFLEPAGHIGEALNRLVTAAFDDLPFYLWLPVFILIVLLIVLAMFFMSGYRVRGWLWNIEPHRPVEPLRERIQLLEQERQALQDERRDLQRQLAVEQHERAEQRVRLGELQRQNTLLYNQLPGLRGEGDGHAAQLSLQAASIISLHSEETVPAGVPERLPLPVPVAEADVSTTLEETEEDYEFVSQ